MTVAVSGDRGNLLKKLAQKHVRFGTSAPSRLSVLGRVLLLMVPLLYLAGLAVLISRMNNTGGVERKFKQKREDTVGFEQVGGIDHAVQEVQEIVNIFKDPDRFSRIGARMPRGILLHGPPGTGKTLLSRALASEAGVPLLYVCASDFVETLVGRGAGRVRALWSKARRQAPSIIFIDELDAIGRRRNRVNSNEEREQTLTALLSEMDGFDTQDSSAPVVVLAATNCVDVLDPALIRPGRFDRRIAVELPDLQGRLAILRCHASRTQSVADLELVASKTAGFSGASLANLVNEAALLAVREGESWVCDRHFAAAVSRAQEAQSGVGMSASASAMQEAMELIQQCTV